MMDEPRDDEPRDDEPRDDIPRPDPDAQRFPGGEEAATEPVRAPIDESA